MLELDSLFSEYLSVHGAGLGDADLGMIEQLLELQDQTIFDAFSGKTRLENPALQRLLQDMMRLVRNDETP